MAGKVEQFSELQRKNMEAAISSASHEEIERLKKEKLSLKDQLYSVLKKAAAA